MEAFVKEFDQLKIRLKEIKLATNNFDEANVIGRGGFGLVYRGELPYLGRVAIKRLNRGPSSCQGDVEFWKEMTTLTHHMHENLVTLQGFCIEDTEMILVYKYESNGSLDSHLRSPDLTWTHRLKICLDVARGLSFLHDANDTKPTIIHKDIKSGNILLDADWNANLSDLGLSETIPTNQQQTGLFSLPGGTRGYIDPQYLVTRFLTTDSDVYSFGVVLLEVSCGKLCYAHSNGHFVDTWKESYIQNQLEEIIFDNLQEKINKKSLEIYSDTAFKCLNNSGVERPPMPVVVKALEKALLYQKLHERLVLPEDYRERLMITAEDPLNHMPEIKQKKRFYKGTLLNRKKTWFSFTMEGKQCEMISIAECLTSTASDSEHYIRSSEYNSKFTAGCYEPFGAGFKTHVRAQFLSPQTMYTVNLVFKRRKKEQYIGLEYKLQGEESNSYSFLSYEREDGWLTAELYQFTSHQRTADFKIQFDTTHCKNLLVEGIEFQPLEKVEHEVIRDENVDMQPISVNGEEWFTFIENGKKCFTLPAMAVLEGNTWKWKLLPETRFEKVAVCSSDKFGIFSKFGSNLLSPQTRYAAYLVYRLPHDFNDVNPPVQVVDITSYPKVVYNIFLLPPKTPVISWNVKEKALSSKPKMKGLPRQRSGNWREVQVYEFQTRANNISVCLEFSSYDMSLAGITVQGLEFRPI